MADIANIVEREWGSLEVFLASFDFSMQEVQDDLFKEILSALKKLSQSNGQLVLDERTKIILSKLEDKIYKIIQKGKYTKEYQKIVSNFTVIEEIRKEINTFLSPKEAKKILQANISPVRKQFIKQLSRDLGSKKTFSINVVEPLKDILIQHATLGMTVNSATNRLFEFAFGKEPGGGKLASYAGQVAHDAIFGFTGAVDGSIGDYIGAKDVNYLGNIIPTSRPQCVRWVGDKFNGFIPVNELQKEIDWALKFGEGYSDHLPKLSIKTFPQVKGGHRCRHRVLRSKGQSSKQIQDIEAEYRKQDKIFNETINPKYSAKTEALYKKNKDLVEKLTQ